MDRATYSPRTGRYRDTATGQFLGHFDLQRIIGEESQKLSRKLLRLNQRLDNGKINDAQWQQGFTRLFKRANLQAMTIGAGGQDALEQNRFNANYFQQTQDAIALVSADTGRVATEFLRGRRTRGQLDGWVKYQSQKLHQTFSRAELLTRVSIQGANEARRTLDPNARHCPQCPSYQTQDFIPIEDVISVGAACVCGGRCRCRVQYRINPERSISGGSISELIQRSNQRHSVAVATQNARIAS